MKVNIVLCLIKVSKCFPKSYIVPRCFATFLSLFPSFLLLPLMYLKYYTAQNLGVKNRVAEYSKHGGREHGLSLPVCFSTIHS